jgi:putative SOS response-associated peptidase YedK
MAHPAAPLPRIAHQHQRGKNAEPRRTPAWFAADKHRPLVIFTGIRRPWITMLGMKAQPVAGEHLLYSFLIWEPNSVVGPIHPTTQGILTTPEEYMKWLS